MFADFHGVNTLTMTERKIPLVEQLACKLPGCLTMSFHELVGAHHYNKEVTTYMQYLGYFLCGKIKV